MDTLSKLIALALVLVAALVLAPPAEAAYTWTSTMNPGGDCRGPYTVSGAAPVALLQQQIATINACVSQFGNYPDFAGTYSLDPACTDPAAGVATLSCAVKRNDHGNVVSDGTIGAVRSGDADTCPAKKGQGAAIFIANSDYNPGSLYANGTCNNGCIITPGNLDPGWKLGDVLGWKGAGIYSGASCTAQPGGSGGSAPSSSPSGGDSGPTSCPAGQTWGQVNNVNVCSPTPNGQGSNYSQTSTSQSTSTPNAGGGDPSTSSTATTTGKDTKCEGGMCTTTTTTTNITTNNPGGTGGTPSTNPPVTTTNTQQQPQADFCKDNPQAAMCKNASLNGGGNCITPITVCDGDAIACNIARNTWAMTCAFQQTNATSTLGQGVIDGAMPGNDPRDNVKDIALPSVLTVTNPYSNSCPADKVISLPQSKTLTIPLTRLCPYLQIMGNILVSISLIMALSIVFKRS